GVLYLRARRAVAAASPLAEAAVRAPRRADPVYALGVAYLAMGDDKRAASAFEEAEKRSPDYTPWCARRIGLLKERAGARDAAVAELRRALRSSSAVPPWQSGHALG